MVPSSAPGTGNAGEAMYCAKKHDPVFLMKAAYSTCLSDYSCWLVFFITHTSLLVKTQVLDWHQWRS